MFITCLCVSINFLMAIKLSRENVILYKLVGLCIQYVQSPYAQQRSPISAGILFTARETTFKRLSHTIQCKSNRLSFFLSLHSHYWATIARIHLRSIVRTETRKGQRSIPINVIVYPFSIAFLSSTEAQTPFIGFK